jgi:hypothetical protein
MCPTQKKIRRPATKNDRDISILRKNYFLLFPVSGATQPKIPGTPGTHKGPAQSLKD